MKRGDPIDLLVVPDWVGEPRTVLALIGTVAHVEPCPYADRPDHVAEAELRPCFVSGKLGRESYCARHRSASPARATGFLAVSARRSAGVTAGAACAAARLRG